MASIASPDANVLDILKILESKTTGHSERCEAYARFSRHFQENEVSLFSLDVSKSISRVLAVIKKDISNGASDVATAALQILGACLHDTDVVNALKQTEAKDVLKTLCITVNQAEEKTVCSCALWCLKSQNIDQTIVEEKAEEILLAVEYAMEKWSGTSSSVVNECINTIERLHNQAPREMSTTTFRWGKLLLPLLVHEAVRVRERALTVVEDTMSVLIKTREDIVKTMASAIKTKIIPRLKTLFKENQEVYTLKCWGTLVQLFGVELHRVSYINDFLSVVEMGFKSTEAEVKIAAFQAWHQLINNFALNQAVLQDPKRIKLIMQVFKHNNARNENVAMEKLRCWWHFIWLLGNKVSPNFDMVAAPLLYFCVGGKSADQTGSTTPKVLKPGASPVTPHMKLTSTGTLQYPVFKELQLLGCEVLAYFLGNPDSGALSHRFKLDCLQHEVVTGPSFFIKHSTLFIRLAVELFCNLGQDVPEGLVLHIWQWLIAHLKNAIESPTKLEIRETLSTLLLQFQILVLSKNLPSTVILKMFDSVCSLPKKILCSSAYSIVGEEMVNGTPALFIAGLLLTPNLLQTCAGLESYHSIFSSLLTSGMGNSVCTLGFLQSVLEILKNNTEFIENKEQLWRLWSAVVSSLTENISKTNEVNQGDSLEHDFSCSVLALVFPATQNFHTMPQPSIKTMMKTWTELYNLVNRLAAMVTNAEANIVCEEVCSKLLDSNHDDASVDAAQLDVLVQMCHVIVSCLDFSSVGSSSAFNLSVSPKKWAKKRQRPLENIHSLVHLQARLQKRALILVADTESQKRTTGVSLQIILNTLVDIFATMFNHVTSSDVLRNLIGHLARPLGDLFDDTCKRHGVKVYNNAFSQKLEKLWTDICLSLQSRYTAIFDEKFLHELSPLLEATFLHSRRQIKNQTLALWSSTFGKSSVLEYPESLKPFLSEVKAKSLISLPGWSGGDTVVIEETPVSQMTQTQAPEPYLPGMPSPHKIQHGSFLNKTLSPKSTKSPLKPPASSPGLSALSPGRVKKKVLSLDGFDDGEFVTIKYSPKKKMLLTDHQKEMLKEKRALPAMYNNLENSVDASLMSAHFSTDTQMEASLAETPTQTSSQPFTVFGSIIPLTGQQQKTNNDNEQQMVVDGKVLSKENSRTRTRNSPNQIPPTAETNTNRRRSVRFRDSMKDKEDKEGEAKAETEKMDENKTTKATLSEGKPKRNIKNTSKKSGSPSASKIIESDSVVVIHDSEPMDTDDNDIVDDIDKNKPKTDGKNVPLKKDKELNIGKGSKDMDKSEEIDLTNISQSITSSNATTQGEKEDISQSKTSSSGSVVASVPQNVLEAVGYTQLSLKSSSDENKSSSAEEENIPRDVASEQVTKEKKSAIEDKASSEPLLSWTQKLNELSQSPRLKSPVRKCSSCPDSVKSPHRRSRSPAKSPRRNKAKLADENQAKGGLDKWLIRSPGKKSLEDHFRNEDIVANVSQTIVEETQSPSKFSNKDKKDITMSPSIMETPPKSVLENITVSHVNSNRKLFSSQGSEVDPNIVEDSNIVPDSPKSKLGRTGTPVLKLKKLTSEEILMYSPSSKDKDVVVDPNKSTNKIAKPTEKIKKLNMDVVTDESSHEHDDFSVFTPLDQHQEESDQFFSKSLTNTDQALLKISENSMRKPDSEITELSGSENLFSQDETGKPTDHGQMNSSEFDPCLVDTLKESNDKASQESSQSQSLSSQDLREMEMGESSQDRQKDTFDVSKDNTLASQTGTPVGKGRKRKQITPKKMTPDEMKQSKKKKKDDNSGSVRKISTRLKDKKDHESGQKDTKEGKLTQSPEEKVKEPGRKTDSKDKLQKLQNVDSGFTSDANKKSAQDENKVDKVVSVKNAQKSKEEVKLPVNMEQNEESEEAKTSTDTDSQPVCLDDIVTEKISKKQERKKLTLKEKKNDKDEKRSVEKGKGDVSSKTKNGKDKTEINSVLDEKNKSDSVNSSKSDNGDVKIDRCSLNEDNFDESMNVDDTTTEVEDPLGEVEIVGQKTPETNKTKKEPERRSTTKHKKAVVQKMSLRRSKDVTVNDSDSNLDGEDVRGFDDERKTASEKTIIIDDSTESDNVSNVERLENDSLQNPDNNKTKLKDKDAHVTTEEQEKPLRIESEATSESDDNIPIAAIKDRVQKKGIRKNNKQKDKKLETESPESPVTHKLRSNKFANTRLRSGEKNVKRSPQARKSVNLAVKRSHKKNADKKHEDNTEKLENVQPEAKDEETLLDNSEGLVSGEIDAKKAQTVANPEQINVDLDQTPKKPTDLASRTKVSEMMMLRNSDSKLVVGSRSFEKKSSIARRSILKHTDGLPGLASSPQRSTFHPITVGRIYSPTASPSASILKKRRLSGDCVSETSSPPNKQRRVSFATPLTEISTGSESERPSSPLVIQDKSPLEVFQLEKETEAADTETQSGKFMETQSTPGSPSQKTYESTQDTQMNTTDPVCPELIGCNQSVEKILPQLTSSVWSRGLTQLVKARNIHTIGDLSALTEGDIHSLPIRSPKVVTVKNVLTKYGKTLESSRAKLWKSPKVRLDVQLKSGEDSAQTKESTSNEDSQQKPAGDQKDGVERRPDDIETLLAGSGDLLDEVNRLTDQSGDTNMSCDQPFNQSGESAENIFGAIKTFDDIMKLGVKELVQVSDDDLTKLGVKDLVQVSDTLMSVQMMVNNVLVMVNKRLKALHSQESQNQNK